MKHADKKHPEEAKKGSEDKSIRQDRKASDKYKYPEPGLADKQFKDQPEFIEPEPNKKNDNNQDE